jgi:hypothetical protein
MGTNSHGTVTVGGQKVNCEADFASDHVVFSGGRRGEVKYAKIKVLGTARGVLKLEVDGAVMEFPLGDKVDRIANKIRSPPSLLDKLGVKPGTGGHFEGTPAWFAKQATEAGLKEGLPGKPTPVLIVGVRALDELAFDDWKRRLTPEGGVWVVYRKGGRDPREAEVIEAGRAAGLKDIKNARFDDAHTAHKFVLPLVDRPA